MSNNFQRFLIFTLSIFLTATGFQNTHLDVYAQNKTSSGGQMLVNPSLKKLSQDPLWNKLSTIWKKINQHEVYDDDFGFNDYKEVENMKKDVDLVKGYLNQLQQKGLINTDEEKSLLNIFTMRYSHLLSSRAMCYETMPFRANVQFKLAERYNLLEKLFSEGKLSDQAYETAKKQFKESFQALKTYEPDNFSNITPDAELIDIVIYLNK